MHLRLLPVGLAFASLACSPPVGQMAPPEEEPESTSTGEPTEEPSTSDSSSGAVDTTGDPEPVCGDGVVDTDEECDQGMDNADDAACTSTCTAAICGDGLVYEGVEECDDGNRVDDDECSNACEVPGFCGDGEVEGEEECDEGDANGDSGACLSDCTPAVCGDGLVHTGVEECDDGNTENNDACTELCAPPTCGDGFVQSVLLEDCDDGDGMEGDECNDDCTTFGEWTATYNGPSNNNEEVRGVAVDSGANVIAVGETFAGGNGDDVWIRKYGSDGSVQWTETFHGGVTSDAAYGVAVNGADNIFVGGSTFTAGNGRDTWLRRYTAGGSVTWTETFNGSANEDDEIHGVTVDPSGNVVVAGYVTTAGEERNIWVRKYSAGGSTMWTRTAAGTGSNNDEANGVTTDAAGNVIVTGYIWAGGAGRDVWVRKYSSGGTEQWTETHDGPLGDNDQGNGVVTDAAGNVVVVGYETVMDDGRNIWVRKYDPDGATLWTDTVNGPSGGNDQGRGVTVDGADMIIVAGSVFHAAESDNIWVRKYTSDGAIVWSAVHTSPGFGTDSGAAVATDPADHIAVGGYETLSGAGEFRNTWVRRVLQ